MKLFAKLIFAGIALSGPAMAGPPEATIAEFGVACPSMDDLYTLYKTDMDATGILAFASKHHCSTVSAGASFPLVDRGPFVSRILVHSDVMFVRSIDLQR